MSMFDGYTNKEQRLLTEHQTEVLRRKAAGNPMTAQEELDAAQKVLSEIDLMWYAANVEANRRRSRAGVSGLAVGVCYPPCS